MKFRPEASVATHFCLLAVAASADLLLDELGAPFFVVQVLLLLPRLLFLAADGLRVAVDVLNVPAFRGLVNFAQTWAAILNKLDGSEQMDLTIMTFFYAYLLCPAIW